MRENMKGMPYATLLLVAACSGQVTKPTADESVLLIQVDAILQNNKGSSIDVDAGLLVFKLKNMDTGRVYTFGDLRKNAPAVVRVAPGAYCMYAFNTYMNMEFSYCDSPYFKVAAGEVNNAGRWRFGVSYETHTFQLLYSMHALDDVLAQAKVLNPSLFKLRQAAP